MVQPKTIRQRRIKVGNSYTANGYGRGHNTKNVYLIDGKCYAYHPKYANQSFTPLKDELKGYVEVNYLASYDTFYQLSASEVHNTYNL